LQEKVRLKRFMECKTARADTLVNDEGIGPGLFAFQ
jgi:hypothetical protein